MSTGPPQEPIYMVTDRQLRALRNVYALNDGWPFGDGPLQWFVRAEVRMPEHGPNQLHIVCPDDGQSVFCLSLDLSQRGYTWNLELLKSRVADHVLKCHPEAAT